MGGAFAAFNRLNAGVGSCRSSTKDRLFMIQKKNSLPVDERNLYQTVRRSKLHGIIVAPQIGGNLSGEMLSVITYLSGWYGLEEHDEHVLAQQAQTTDGDSK
jgi:hypothetical protein